MAKNSYSMRYIDEINGFSYQNIDFQSNVSSLTEAEPGSECQIFLPIMLKN